MVLRQNQVNGTNTLQGSYRSDAEVHPSMQVSGLRAVFPQSGRILAKCAPKDFRQLLAGDATYFTKGDQAIR